MDTVRTVHSVGDGGLTMASNRALLCFDGRGMATSAGVCEAGNATVTFSSGDRTDTLTTTVLGKVMR